MRFKFSIDIDGAAVQLDNGIKVVMKGALFYKNVKYTVSNMADLIEGLAFEEIKNRLNTSILLEATGRFLMVIEAGDSILVVGDIIRSYPLFYQIDGNNCSLADRIDKIEGNLEIDQERLEEYVVAGFVYGNATLYKGIFGLQAGEMITISKAVVTAERYFEYKPSAKEVKPLDFATSFNRIMTSVFERILQCKTNPNASWIVPLSGGHDSRIVVNYLYLLGVKNVICFSYGIAGNAQSAVSKRVAEALGYEWHFVEYNEQKWKSLHDRGLINQYVDVAANGVSTPHLQDFLAVYELKSKGIISAGDIFLPGHTLDFISGNHLKDEDLLCNNKESGVRVAFERHSLLKNEMPQSLKHISRIYRQANVEPTQFQEYFNWQERQAKFIVNSVRTYEFFGFESGLPFWDRTIVEFWLSLNPLYRKGRNLFLSTERKGILVPELMGIPFEDELRPKKTKHKPKNWLSNLIPSGLIPILLRLAKRKAKFNEGLNQIYALSASSVSELIGPLKNFPQSTQPYIYPYLKRFPYQMNYHLLSCLYAIRIQLNKIQKKRY
ncbi:asparagine synthase C-terminal domain-containing protein [Pedobacter sp. ASV28]|uniref:asparagine synthase C-terminal domain-containing protein n=1 Tax=Pedobacter sp. ASV28 TaxID=2795123 RepID=UPI0018EDE105|nr:asparagine synthase C-terminal domain-containing protein [Pedobacter sp. ASV28]